MLGTRSFRRARWTPGALRGPGTMACGGARPWSFPACATASWRSPCAHPRAFLLPRSLLTRHRNMAAAIGVIVVQGRALGGYGLGARGGHAGDASQGRAA